MTDQTTRRTRPAVTRIARTLAAVALSLGVLAGASEPTEAATGDARLNCGLGSDGYEIFLPFKAEGQYALYFISVDGGAWATTNWIYSGSFRNFEYTASGWQSAGLYLSAEIGGNHSVRAWEYRYFLNGTTQWVNLGACQTSTFNGGGLVFI
jgi:hypothetical protein